MGTVSVPPAPAIGIAGILFDSEGRVLLARRGQAPARGQWHPPGGRLEPGESMIQACRREMAEETGIAPIEVGPIVAVVERRVSGFHYLVIDFLACLPKGSPVPCPRAASDVLEARWVPHEELGGYALAHGLRPILAQARRMHLGEESLGLRDREGGGITFTV